MNYELTFEFEKEIIASKSDFLTLVQIKRTDSNMLQRMASHYSQPLGFVGRNICYAICFSGICYGVIVGGSATMFLPGRNIIGTLNNGVNNIFFHVEKYLNRYPTRNFTTKVLSLYRVQIESDWKAKYGDSVNWHETLVEPPRTGECYKRDGWKLVGTTKGFTCKRSSGQSTDSWSGRRIWNTENLRPKLVFVKSNLNPTTPTE